MSDFAFDSDNNQDEDSAPRTERPQRKRTSPLRFVTPGTFGMAALLFFLPWTDLGCTGPAGKMQLATQSGLQSATGEYSEGESLKELQKMGGGKAGRGDLEMMPGQEGKGKKDGPDKAPLLWLYLVLVIAGAGVPVAIAANKTRGAIVVGFSGAALVVLGIQLAVGFPLPNAAAESNAEMKKMEGMRPPAGGPGGGDLDKLADAAKLNSNYLPSFWLSIFVVFASLALGVVQAVTSDSTSQPRRRRTEDEDDS